MAALEWMVLLALSVLGALKSETAVYWWREKEALLWSRQSREGESVPEPVFWVGKRFWKQAAVWLAGYAGVWLLSGKQMLIIRLFDLFAFYSILSVIDGKRKAVPDSMLLFFWIGQLLCGAVSMVPAALFQTLVSGAVFLLAAVLFSFFSGEQLGMGDAKLLGVTAMAVGWNYVLQLVCISMLLSFVYSILLLLVWRKSKKAEFPFVPFLTAGMVVHFFWLVKIP